MIVLQFTAILVYVLITVMGTLAIAHPNSNAFFRYIARALRKGNSILSTGIVGLILSGLYLGSSIALRFSGVQTGVQTGVLSTVILILAAILTGINLGQTCFGFMNLLEDDTQDTEDPEEE